MNKPNFSAQLTNKAAIEEVAASVGCLHTRGAKLGRGSIRRLLEDLAAGKVRVEKCYSGDNFAVYPIFDMATPGEIIFGVKGKI